MAKEKIFVVKFNEKELETTKIALNTLHETLQKEKEMQSSIDDLLKTVQDMKTGLDQVEEDSEENTQNGTSEM